MNDKWTEFEELLKYADWNYSRADRTRDYERGRDQVNRIRQLKAELEKIDGPRVLELIHKYAAGKL